MEWHSAEVAIAGWIVAGLVVLLWAIDCYLKRRDPKVVARGIAKWIEDLANTPEIRARLEGAWESEVWPHLQGFITSVAGPEEVKKVQKTLDWLKEWWNKPWDPLKEKT